MIGFMIDKIKDVAEIRGYLLYYILGVSYIQLAVLLLFFPVDGHIKYSIVFSFIMIMTGILVTIFSLRNRKVLATWNWHLLSGIIDILWGIFLISYPFKTIVTLPYLIAFWAIIRSCYGLSYSIDLNRLGIKQWYWYRVFDVLVIIGSLIVICIPMTGVFDTTYIVDLIFLCMGFVYFIHSRDLGKLYPSEEDEED